jgi:branched-chain amino acid transport system permease protein
MSTLSLPKPPLLQVADLRRAFGGVQAVAGTMFTVSRGTITGLIGPNGAGKSTVLSLIGGQLRPDAGSIRFGGVEIAGLPPHTIARRGLIRTFQTANLFARMTVLENMLLGAPPWIGESVAGALLGKWFWRRHEQALVDQARAILDRFGMAQVENEYAGRLSGGQKRIVEIMRALMAKPRLLLLDEPMAGVNPTLAGSIANHLTELCAEGITILMVEHEMKMVSLICDPVIVMVQGRVLAEGTMTTLRTNQEVLDAYLAG